MSRLEPRELSLRNKSKRPKGHLLLKTRNWPKKNWSTIFKPPDFCAHKLLFRRDILPKEETKLRSSFKNFEESNGPIKNGQRLKRQRSCTLKNGENKNYYKRM